MEEIYYYTNIPTRKYNILFSWSFERNWEYPSVVINTYMLFEYMVANITTGKLKGTSNSWSRRRCGWEDLVKAIVVFGSKVGVSQNFASAASALPQPRPE
jgi:hypothetical protein